MSVAASFEIHRITPEIVPIAPIKLLTVTFDNNVQVE